MNFYKHGPEIEPFPRRREKYFHTVFGYAIRLENIELKEKRFSLVNQKGGNND